MSQSTKCAFKDCDFVGKTRLQLIVHTHTAHVAYLNNPPRSENNKYTMQQQLRQMYAEYRKNPTLDMHIAAMTKGFFFELIAVAKTIDLELKISMPMQNGDMWTADVESIKHVK